MRKRKFRAQRWAALVLIAAATLTAIGTAGFAYVGNYGGWDGYFGPLSVGRHHTPSLIHHHLKTEPYFRVCEEAHCGHLSAPGKLLGLYDCLALPCGPTRLNVYPYDDGFRCLAPGCEQPRYGYAPYDCYFAPCSPPVAVSQSTSVDVDVNVNNTANVYGGRGATIKQNTNVNVDVDVN